MTMRIGRAAGFTGVVLALTLAACHRKEPEPVPPADQGEPAPAPAPQPAPPPPAPVPAPKPKAAPKPPPAPPVSADQQMRDDAAASGMTGPIEAGNDEAEPASGADNGGASPNGG